MNKAEKKITPETAVAVELFSQLTSEGQDEIIALIKSLLSEQ